MEARLDPESWWTVMLSGCHPVVALPVKQVQSPADTTCQTQIVVTRVLTYLQDAASPDHKTTSIDKTGKDAMISERYVPQY